MARADSIRAKGLESHVDAGKDQQNGRGYIKLVKYLTEGDEFGEAIPVRKLARLYNRSIPTMDKWIDRFCEEQGIPRPDDLKELLNYKAVEKGLKIENVQTS